MIEYMNSLVAALVVLPVVAVIAAAWRGDVAPRGTLVRAFTHSVPATGLSTGADADVTFGTPQSRGSLW